MLYHRQPSLHLQAQAAAAPAGGEAKKLWGGRFTGATDPLMEKFNESLPFDRRMWAEDIRVRADCSPCAGSPGKGCCQPLPCHATGSGRMPQQAQQALFHLHPRQPSWLMCRAARRMPRLWPRREC